jgi:hypothetical protein
MGLKAGRLAPLAVLSSADAHAPAKKTPCKDQAARVQQRRSDQLFFWRHRRWRCEHFGFQTGLELFDRGASQSDRLSMPDPRGYRSCIEGIFLDLAVEKRAFGNLCQVPIRSEVIQTAQKGALHTGYIRLLQTFDAGELLRVRQWGCST